MYKPTESEMAVLQVLWKRGPSTVREVNDMLNAQREVGYTTTLKIMQIMADKSLVTRNLSGRTHIYEAAVEEKDTRQVLLDRFLETAFGGSASRMVMQALGSHTTSPEELDEIRRLLDELDAKKQEDRS